MRSEFEKFPEIKRRLEFCYWSDTDGCYRSNVAKELAIYLNAAWYAFQEQQKKIDEHSKKLKIFIDELKKTHNDDKDNKINYWRGFSDCADSSVKVFLRDVGFIE